MIKCIIVVLCLLQGVIGQAQIKVSTEALGEGRSKSPQEMFVDTTWTNFKVPEEKALSAIVAQREGMENQLKAMEGDAFIYLFNNTKALNCAAAFLRAHKDYKVDLVALEKLIAGLDLRSVDIVRVGGVAYVVDNYYALKAMLGGASIADAWGAMRFNLITETIDSPLDYKKYTEILELNNPALSEAYLECLARVFRYNGITEGMDVLRPVIEKWMPAGKLKESILASYEEFAPFRAGQPAPAFKLKDYTGEEYSLEDFRGKVLVMDVWATWCGGCIQKLPKYKELRESYKDRKDIEFITVSIDRDQTVGLWKELVKKHELTGMKNLFAPDRVCSFKDDYHITGIPRYMVIDREGKIVSIYTPTSGPLLIETIEKALK